ncbi:hypothetical protein EB796_014394 [Bugula neritina]|uniref:Uncharacterized protein n=1 Tax=Bugula neritina TaxID=10212 RepID=A0A7J7JM06_BUGNE|nr:hypothetical protein EB796_014394 [Bugula neritina]
MIEKSDKSKLLGVSLLVISILLVVSVSAVIYMGLTKTHTVCQQKEPEKTTRVSADVQATVNIRTPDNQHVKDQVMLNKDEHVAYYHRADGTFHANLFQKGLRVIRADEGICYISPVAFNEANNEDVVAEFLDNFDDQEIEAIDAEVDVKVLDEFVQDVSFFLNVCRMSAQMAING